MEKNIFLQWATAKVIRDVRKAKGMPQVHLADFSTLSRTYISSLEHGHKGVSLLVLLKIAKALEVDLEEITRLIMEELRQGPTPPPKRQGRPYKRKSAKK